MPSLQPGTILFAPMEGITNSVYRQVILKYYPQWDFVCCSFLRVPSQGTLSTKKIIEHIGAWTMADEAYRKKTILQILASSNSNLLDTCKKISDLKIQWTDLNLGCPSKKVVSHRGGSYLLSDMQALSKIIKTARSGLSGFFSVKMRVGLHDDKNFLKILKLLESEGVDAITVHGRTKDQMYTGAANWDYIKQAQETVNIPIIGNGDVCSKAQVQQMLNSTKCQGVMIGRCGVAAPWLAKSIKDNVESLSEDTIKQNILEYCNTLTQSFELASKGPIVTLNKLKGVCHHLFDNLDGGQQMKHLVLRSKTLQEFQQRILALLR
ncbi:MAG: tRNA-dihydrouridine synthase family protein [Bacteriovoracaceae bacterium]|nr:tRNA-dihydrouridine synthase family protein [Bacteriovoracaceae bacterium]